MKARFRRGRERSRLLLREISLPRELKSGWGRKEWGRNRDYDKTPRFPLNI